MTTKSMFEDRATTEQPRVPSATFALRALHLLLTLLFIGAIGLQVFFAGATLLADSRYLLEHRSFGAALAPLPLLMIAASLLGRLPRRVVLFSILLLVLYVMQFVLVFAVPSLGLPAAFRALHAVNALVLFWAALHTAKSTWRVLRPQARNDDS